MAASGKPLRCVELLLLVDLSLLGRLGRALLPGLEIHRKQLLLVISKRITDAQHCLKVVAPRTARELALVGSMARVTQVSETIQKLSGGEVHTLDLGQTCAGSPPEHTLSSNLIVQTPYVRSPEEIEGR
jgi:hypothetical protein